MKCGENLTGGAGPIRQIFSTKAYKSDVKAAIHETVLDLHDAGLIDKHSAGPAAKRLSIVADRGLSTIA